MTEDAAAAGEESADGSTGGPEIPAATAVVGRDGAHGMEILMLRRASTLSFAPGAWVCPGGHVDPADAGGDPLTSIDAARRAAVRESREEAGLDLDEDSLSVLSLWAPGVGPYKRFTTWIMFGAHSGADVVVDGREITEHRWLTPTDALAEHARGDMELLPPTWVTLYELARHRSVSEAAAAIDAVPIECYESQVAHTEAGIICLWRGDAGYEEGDPDRAGARHRLCMVENGPWRYERDEDI